MKCLILAGGKGSRLNPLSHFLPKHLLPIGEKRVIDYVMDFVHSLDLDPIFVKLNNYPNLDIETFNVLPAKNLIETLYMAKSKINEDQFCWTGCEFIIDNLDFELALQKHISEDALMTHFYTDGIKYTPRGIVRDNKVVEFSSDISKNYEHSFITFMLSHKKAFEKMKKYGINFEQESIKEGELILAHLFKNRAWNIDTPKDYFNASIDLLGEYVSPNSEMKDSKLSKSFVYNSDVRYSEIINSILINTSVSNKKLENKILYGGKDGCILDIPYQL